MNSTVEIESIDNDNTVFDGLKKLSNEKKYRPLSIRELLDAPRSPIFEVRIRQSEVLRTAGNDCFKQGLIDEAVKLCEYNLHSMHAIYSSCTQKTFIENGIES